MVGGRLTSDRNDIYLSFTTLITAATLSADELPKSGPGEVLKRELREPYWEGQDKKVN
jgi:hypothetical protein